MAVVILALTPVGEATAEFFYHRFQLFNNCEPMYLVVEGGLSSDPDAARIGLTEESIQATVESRLRSARLYSSDRYDSSFLYVNVTVVRTAFNIELEYHKEVLDLASGRTNRAATWSIGTTGIQSSGASYILSSISRLMDEFLVEFLRVNEEAC